MTKKKANNETDPLRDLNTAAAKAVLQNVLSDLERAAFKSGFTPFTYTLKTKSIYISAPACRLLLNITRQKLDLLTDLALQEQLFGSIPYKYRVMLYDPRVVLSLPTPMRQRLSKVECYTLRAIQAHGRNYFLDELNFSKGYMKTLDGLFDKCKAKHLFT